MRLGDKPSESSERGPEEFYNQLDPVDKGNVQRFIDLLGSVLTLGRKKGAVIGVGGTFREGGPDKDIDLVFEVEDNAPTQQLSLLERFKRRFTSSREVIEQAVADSEFQIGKVIEPYEDPEHGGFPGHEGSIELRPPQGKKIEVVIGQEDDTATFVQRQSLGKRLWSLLNQW